MLSDPDWVSCRLPDSLPPSAQTLSRDEKIRPASDDKTQESGEGLKKHLFCLPLGFLLNRKSADGALQTQSCRSQTRQGTRGRAGSKSEFLGIARHHHTHRGTWRQSRSVSVQDKQVTQGSCTRQGKDAMWPTCFPSPPFPHCAPTFLGCFYPSR